MFGAPLGHIQTIGSHLNMMPTLWWFRTLPLFLVAKSTEFEDINILRETKKEFVSKVGVCEWELI